MLAAGGTHKRVEPTADDFSVRALRECDSRAEVRPARPRPV
jgi:hypothetical protein